MSTLEERIAALEARLDRLEPHINRSIPLGPRQRTDKEVMERVKRTVNEWVKAAQKDVPPADRTQQQLVSGAPVPEDRSHTELKSNGQQKDYVVLSPDERAKGFVRPVRKSYRHVGAPGPQYPLRDLMPEEEKRWGYLYAKFEPYPGEADICNGRFWMQEQLDAIGNGCNTVTTMGLPLAETYARDPKFYGGTYCCGCGQHHPVEEFVWDGTDERVGS